MEIGTHATLMAKKGIYFGLHQASQPSSSAGPDTGAISAVVANRAGAAGTAAAYGAGRAQNDNSGGGGGGGGGGSGGGATNRRNAERTTELTKPR